MMAPQLLASEVFQSVHRGYCSLEVLVLDILDFRARSTGKRLTYVLELLSGDSRVMAVDGWFEVIRVEDARWLPQITMVARRGSRCRRILRLDLLGAGNQALSAARRKGAVARQCHRRDHRFPVPSHEFGCWPGLGRKLPLLLLVLMLFWAGRTAASQNGPACAARRALEPLPRGCMAGSDWRVEPQQPSHHSDRDDDRVVIVVERRWFETGCY